MKYKSSDESEMIKWYLTLKSRLFHVTNRVLDNAIKLGSEKLDELALILFKAEVILDEIKGSSINPFIQVEGRFYQDLSLSERQAILDKFKTAMSMLSSVESYLSENIKGRLTLWEG